MATGNLVRVRRDWFATPECRAQLVQAVRVGGALACLSAAELLGLWALDDGCLHVRVEPTSGRLQLPRGGVKVHWATTAAPAPLRRAIDTIDDVLVHVARCQPVEFAAAVYDSALRKGLVSVAELARLAQRFGGRVAAVARVADGRADSGIETIPRVRLRALGITMVPQVRIDGHRVDGLIGRRLVIQCDGFGPHSTREQRDKDLREDVRLVRLGYHVLRFSYHQLVHEWEWVLSEILSAIAQGKHL